MANGIYRGRLEADGYGNLLASEGEYAGHPVAAQKDGSYAFIQLGEPSHNERFDQGTKEISMTQDKDPEAPHYAGTSLADAPEGTEHHWGPKPDDPHYDEKAVENNRTKIRIGADKQEAIATSHTEAYSNE